MSETFAFQAEINQLLSLIINTFYSNKEVFLRELVSNASDALDKVRYASLTNPDILKDESELSIKIIPDETNNTLTIWDTGVGMTRDELIKNLGTIAHSGTRQFMESLKDGTDVSLIGQFGVGFYSAFLVADSVKVYSRSLESDKTCVWESSAGGSFSINEADESECLTRGTKIVLHLKEDQKEYTDQERIRQVLTKHSQYLGFPIKLQVTRETEVPVDVTDVPDVTEEEVKQNDGDVADVADDESDDEDDVKPPKMEKKTVVEFDIVNKQQPIWARKSEDVTHDEYAAFYRSMTNDWEDHMAVKHFSVEGQVEFKSLLYIPPRAPFDMFSGGASKKMNNIKLYVRKVLIMDESNDLLPEYLSFFKGVVDSDDLPLNVSREMLQQNNIMKVIKKNLVKKCIETMSELTQDAEKWGKFYQQFSKNIKLGYMEDQKSRTKIVELLRFVSSYDDKLTSLKDYVSRMKENQKDIFYVTGEHIDSVKNMACIEKLKKKNYEVLFLIDPIDEYLVQHLHEYDSKRLVNCSKEGFALEDTEEEKKQKEEVKKEWDGVCKRITSILGDKVKDVVISDRLVTRPCVLVSDVYGWTANMEKIMKAQALRSGDAMMMMGGKRILEINPDHKILKYIKERIDSNAAEKPLENIINLLHDTVMLDSGFTLSDPSKYTSRVYTLIENGLTGDEENEENEEGEGDEEDIDLSTLKEKSDEKNETSMEDVD
jgi:molecular chaperone HtpG